MTQEEKELLLKDLCGRLSYGVKIELMPITRGKCTKLTPIILQDYYISNNVNYLPYLRPMSSMTEEEVDEFIQFDVYSNGEYIMPNYETIDWLNDHHFDYRGLIERGLALEAPEGMYN